MIENAHISFCKDFLRMQKQTSLVELGRVPLMISAKKNSVNNCERIANKNLVNKIVNCSHSSSLFNNLGWVLPIKQYLGIVF